jgi:hypothetical protein
VADIDKSEKITINLGLIDLGQIDPARRRGLLHQPHGLHPNSNQASTRDPRRCGERHSFA